MRRSKQQTLLGESALVAGTAVDSQRSSHPRCDPLTQGNAKRPAWDFFELYSNYQSYKLARVVGAVPRTN